MSLAKHQIYKLTEVIRDTRSLFKRALDNLARPQVMFYTSISAGTIIIFLPALAIPAVVVNVIMLLWYLSVKNNFWLPMQVPQQANLIDPSDINAKDSKPEMGKAIFFLGNSTEEHDFGAEAWLNNDQIRTHFFVGGTTGSGKSLKNSELIPVIDCTNGIISKKEMGLLKVGDYALDKYFQPNKVLGVFPQGNRSLLRLEFYDGRFMDCSKDHLWLIGNNSRQTVMSAKELMRKMECSNGVFWIPNAKNYREGKLNPNSKSSRHIIKSVKDYHQNALCTCITVASPDGLFLAGDNIVTHNSQSLFGMMENSLSWGSGFLNIDGKGENTNVATTYSLVKRFGRDDHYFILNFMTSNFDTFSHEDRNTSLLGNTFNPFSTGTTDDITQTIVSQLGSTSGEGKMWQDRTILMVDAVIRYICYLRNSEGKEIDVSTLRASITLESIIGFARKLMYSKDPIIRAMVFNPIESYLRNLPGLIWDNHVAKELTAEALEKMHFLERAKYEINEKMKLQHDSLSMQLLRSLSMLADTYRHIFLAQIPEIDVTDVILNRRIVSAVIPNFRKSPAEAQALGKLCITALKIMMGQNLGSSVEGRYEDIIESKATNAPNPYQVQVDEVGAIYDPGLQSISSQARSLGISLILATQDVESMVRDQGDERSVKSMLANTKIKGSLALEDPDRTYDFYNRIFSKVFIKKTSGFSFENGKTIDSGNSSYEERDRVSLSELKALETGHGIWAWKDRVVKLRSFMPIIDGHGNAEEIRINRPVGIYPPSIDMLIELNYCLPPNHQEGYQLRNMLLSKSYFDGVKILSFNEDVDLDVDHNNNLGARLLENIEAISFCYQSSTGSIRDFMIGIFYGMSHDNVNDNEEDDKDKNNKQPNPTVETVQEVQDLYLAEQPNAATPQATTRVLTNTNPYTELSKDNLPLPPLLTVEPAPAPTPAEPTPTPIESPIENKPIKDKVLIKPKNPNEIWSKVNIEDINKFTMLKIDKKDGETIITIDGFDDDNQAILNIPSPIYDESIQSNAIYELEILLDKLEKLYESSVQ